MQGLWAKTAASGFRMTERTLPGRYGLPFGNRDSLRSIHPPPAGVSLRAWRPARHLRGGGLPGLILWGATTRRAIPCVGAAWGRPPGAGFPPGGRSPSGGACPAGAKTISFSAEKETVLDSKEKVRPVYGALVLGKRRLASLRTVWGPAPAVTAMPWWNRDRLWFYLAAAWRCHSRGRVRHGAPSSPHLAFSRSAAREAPDHPGPERGTRRRRADRTKACPCS